VHLRFYKMRIANDLRARCLARAFALLPLGLIAASCSSDVASFSENSFVSNGSRALPSELTDSVPRAKATPVRQLEESPVGLQAASHPSPAAVESPSTINSINVSGPLNAEPRVILLRGWFGVFSTGLDSLAEKLRARGINAELSGHLSWYAVVSDILRERAAGKTGPLVLVGHSQGANNAIAVARSLQAHKVKVDLLVTLAPFVPPPIPGNVVRAVNYYQFPGWGSPLTPDRGFDGSLSNINMVGDLTAFHITIDKGSKIHEAILREIAAL
jgi:pimeloyl-ACP methyl ester carboxylesterase